MTYTGAMTMPSTSIALPQNAVIMQEEEMCYVEGGKIPKGATLKFYAAGALIWTIGYNAKTPYSRYVTKNGKKYYVSYNPTKGLVKFGKKTCYVGNWMMGHVSSLHDIINGINGYLKLK